MPEGTKVGEGFVEISPEIDALLFAASGRSAGEIFEEEFNKEINQRFRKGIREKIKLHLDTDVDSDSVGRLGSSVASGLTSSVESSLKKTMDSLLKAVPGQFAEVLGSPAGGVLIAVLAPIVTFAGITIGAMLGGAIAEGLSLGAIGLGLMVAFKDPTVKAAGKTLAATLGAELQDASGPFKAQVIDSIQQISQTLGQQDFSKFFTALAPSIKVIGDAIKDIIPGLISIGNKAAFLAEAFAPVTAEFIKKLIPAIDKFMMTLIKNLPGIQSAFVFLGNIIIGLIDFTGDLIGNFAHMFENIVIFSAKAVAGLATLAHGLEELHLVSAGTSDKLFDMANNMMKSLDVSGHLATTTGDLSGIMATLGSNTGTATSAQDAFRKSVQDTQQAVVAQIDATEAYAQAKLSLQAANTQGAQALTLNTEAGLRNRDMLEEAAVKSRELAYQELLTGVSLQEVTAHHQQRIDRLITENFTSAQTRDEARKLAEQYGAIPTDVKTILELIGKDDVTKQLDDLKVKQISLWKNISETEARSNIEKGMADGGYVQGPGGPTDDSIPARLSNGEFVMKAAAVNQYGVDKMHAINQGVLPGFAEGGPVGSDWPFPVDVSQTKIDASWADGPKVGKTFAGGAGAGAMGMGDLSGLSGSLGDWIKAASAYVNIEWPEGLLTLIMRESGGNPFSINLWDINAQNGDPSGGLMQTIGATFRAHADPRLPGNMFDPVANIVAGMNYIHSRYGSLYNVQQAHSEMPPMGYDNGGWLMPGTTMVANKTGKPEAVFTGDQLEQMSGWPKDLVLVVEGEPIKARIVKSQSDTADALRRGRGRTP